MKKTSYLATLAVATLALASCTNESYVGDNLEGTGRVEAIEFTSTSPNSSRATLFGSDAATKLGNHFVVYGTKHCSGAETATAENDNVVFNQYNVVWNGNAGATQTNDSGWEYVGQTPYSSSVSSQTVKYWDYSANNGYTFTAFSSADISYPSGSDKVSVNKVTNITDAGATAYNKGYAVTVRADANLSSLYFSDRVVVPETDYGKTVSLTFRNIGTKVRVGFYETIAGYSVKIDNFRIDKDADDVVTTFAAMKDEYTTGFAASLQNVKTDAQQTLNVNYYDNTKAEIENRPTVSNPTGGYYYTLKLGSGVINTTLATQTANPTWDQTGGAYTTVYPFEGNTNPMIVKLDFTMTAEDGSGETIKVKGARAVVPAQYVQWKSNFAYTYIFKISDATNGTTGDVDENDDPTDPEGLKPITFDAVVVDAATDQTQQTITTVATNSITTYQNGVKHESTNEYNAGDIYVVNSKVSDNSVIKPSAIGDAAGNAQVYTVTSTGDAITESSVLAKLLGSANGLTLTAVSPAATIGTTVPLADGTTATIDNVKFTGVASTTYAYVYTTAKYVAPTYTLEASSNTYDSSKTYYMKVTVNSTDVYYAVTVANAAAYAENKANLYQKTADGTPGQYDIKVIKVQ